MGHCMKTERHLGNKTMEGEEDGSEEREEKYPSSLGLCDLPFHHHSSKE